MVQKQYDIDPLWFTTNTPYPINTTRINTSKPLLNAEKETQYDSNGNTIFEMIVLQSINNYWYKIRDD